MIVLDTNVLSEMLKGQPSAQVAAWLAGQPPASIFTTTVTQAEILYGLKLLPQGQRRTLLEAAIRLIFDEDLAGKILPFDGSAADAYSNIAADRKRAGRPISQFDAQIAGIALSRGAAIATRNVADFHGAGVEIINPWSF